MKINLKWSKKQLKIMDVADLDVNNISCIHNEKKNSIVITVNQHKAKRIKNLIVESSPKNGDIFDLKTGIRVAKLFFMKKVCEYNVTEIQESFRKLHNFYHNVVNEMRSESTIISEMLARYNSK